VMDLAGDVDAAEHLEITTARLGDAARVRQLRSLLSSRADQPRTNAPAATLREGIQSWAMSLSAVTHVLRPR
jgi:hypothetical protein